MFDALHGALLRYARPHAADDEAAYEAVQAAFITLWQRRRTLDPEHALEAWLYSLVYHRAVNDPHTPSPAEETSAPAPGEASARSSFKPDPKRVQAVRAAIGEAVVARPRHPYSLEILAGTVPRPWAVTAAAVLIVAVGAWLLLQPASVHAPPGETLPATLPDGSTVVLNSGSRLAYARPFTWGARSVRLTGEASFDVAANAQKPFTVETFNARIEATEGRFNVHAWPDDPAPATTVVAAAGQVRLAALDTPDQAVTLTADQASHVSGDAAAPSTVTPRSAQQTLSWQQGGFFFSDHPVAAILAEIERRFGIPVRAPQALAQRRLGFYLKRADGPEAVLDALCSFLTCHYRTTPTGFALQPGASE